MVTKAVAEPVIIRPLNLRMLEVVLIGDTPLITHPFSEKAIKIIEDTQAGNKKPKSQREIRDPQAEYEASKYLMPDGSGCGFPSVGIKKAMIDASPHCTSAPKTLLRGAFYIEGELCKIDGDPIMRKDMVRLNAIGKPADVRYRAQFDNWRATLLIRYNADVIAPPMLLSLLQHAGFAVGIGEWRPERNGQYGMFHPQAETEAKDE